MENLIIEHEYPQRSEEWFAVKLGKISGSIMPDLMPANNPRKEWTDTQLKILTELAAQILTGERKSTPYTPAMEWGTIQEEAAKGHYIKMTGYAVRDCGFFENYALPGCGVSPDGIIIKPNEVDAVATEDGDGPGLFQAVAKKSKIETLEIKCPNSDTHLKYFLDPVKLWEQYKWQVYMEVGVTESDGGEIISFDPRMPEEKKMVRYIPELKEEDMNKLTARLMSAAAKIKEMIK